ncbi:hypothetical protein Ga0123462_0104 [Mariprofundus ferrinatatus]|uniref:Uncharacterized protein n=2 Tax=Mariprofundus ferrinatatus TaxID=1921087 RepID=A0A2K8L166_9PROT|nr:hypothetical protein Ga0123462_0104 [Mariprofundus ferrinatatus]
MHLSLQIRAQKQAEESIYGWAETANVKVGDVRYHLLRNGLILKGIEIERGSDALVIDHMLVRANPKLLTSNAPRIGTVAISGLQAELHYQGLLDTWQNDEVLQRIWKATGALHVDDGIVALYLENEEAPPLIIDAIQLSLHALREDRVVSLTSQFHGAPVQAHWLRSEKPASVSRGELTWRDVDVSLLSPTLPIGPTAGQLAGTLQWERGESGSGGDRLNGSMRLKHAFEDNRIQLSGLKWKGERSDDRWNVAINSSAWPLDGWGAYLPKIEGRALLSGRLDGDISVQTAGDGLLLKGDKGRVRNIAFALPSTLSSGLQRDHWRIESLDYRAIALDTGNHTLDASTLKLSNSSIAFQPLGAQNGNDQQRPVWSVRADTVGISTLNVVMMLPEGDIQLSGIGGNCSLTARGLSDIKLHSSDSEGRETDPKWSVTGELLRQEGSVQNGELEIRAEQVPLTQLRPLLPFGSPASSPLSLEGTTSLAVQAKLKHGKWVMLGKATSESVLLSYAGNRWMAERVNSDFGPVGMGLDRQRVSRLHAEQWHYIASLIPLPFQRGGEKADMVQANKRSWWAEGMLAGRWEIDKLTMSGGTVSVGQPESEWVTDAELRLSQLTARKLSTLSMHGNMGEGQLKLDGSWSPLASQEKFLGNIELVNATPLFLSEWMRASGMPKPVRGRISASLQVSQGDQPDQYAGKVAINIERALVEHAVASNDPMIGRIGYNTIDLLKRLESENGKISLQFPVEGSWSERPLGLHTLGLSMQKALRESATRPFEVASVSRPVSSKTATRIRLRERGALSLNERTRLLNVAKKMRSDSSLVVDLIPKWAGDRLDRDTVQRIKHTRRLIERYLNYRGVSKQRIFPMAATAQDHAGEIASIWVVLSSAK